mmetsp:Transcript_127826/g.284911  ORF Transcript_127826/g.284911 Transcript_127826/m.284911 type:complete len:284 (+) Transcript_127826:1058-1909(+)
MVVLQRAGDCSCNCSNMDSRSSEDPALCKGTVVALSGTHGSACADLASSSRLPGITGFSTSSLGWRLLSLRAPALSATASTTASLESSNLSWPKALLRGASLVAKASSGVPAKAGALSQTTFRQGVGGVRGSASPVVGTLTTCAALLPLSASVLTVSMRAAFVVPSPCIATASSVQDLTASAIASVAMGASGNLATQRPKSASGTRRPSAADGCAVNTAVGRAVTTPAERAPGRTSRSKSGDSVWSILAGSSSLSRTAAIMRPSAAHAVAVASAVGVTPLSAE